MAMPYSRSYPLSSQSPEYEYSNLNPVNFVSPTSGFNCVFTTAWLDDIASRLLCKVTNGTSAGYEWYSRSCACVLDSIYTKCLIAAGPVS